VKLCIPAPKTRLTLAQDWTFDLPNFYWNYLFWKQLFSQGEPRDEVPFRRVTLAAGTVLTISKYDFRPDDPYPIRFHLRKSDNPKSAVYGRFWLTLQDANQVELL
jgi:hypothetical protein